MAAKTAEQKQVVIEYHFMNKVFAISQKIADVLCAELLRAKSILTEFVAKGVVIAERC